MSSLAFMVGCGGDEPVTAEKSKFEVAGEESGKPAGNGASQKTPAGSESEESPFAPTGPSGGNSFTDEKTAKSGEEPGAEVAIDTSDYGASPQYPLPKGGSPQDIAEFLQNLDEKKPKGTTKKEQEADYIAIQDSRLAAARKLLTFRIQPQMKVGLLQLMMEIHQGFIENKIEGAEQRLDAFAQELSNHKDPQIAELGRVQAFDISVNKLAKTDPPPADGKEVAAAIEKFVEDAKGSPAAFLAAVNKCISLQQMEGATREFKKDLIEQVKKVAERYKDSSVPQVASQAKQVLEMAPIFEAEIDIQPKYEALTKGEEGAEEPFLAAMEELLKKQEPSAPLVELFQTRASELEFGYGKLSAVLRLFEMLETAIKGKVDKDLEEQITQRAADARTRIGLVGKPLAIEGVTPDGKDFDFATYKDKYVLVDFWATWCGPCLQELPNVKQNYAAYHAKGFEVVGISLDSELNELKEFLSLQELPWKTIVSKEFFEKKSVENGMTANPVAVACGVKAIPFVLLLGKDGVVDSIHVRGPKLEARLKELLGEPAEKPAGEEGSEKKPANKPTEKPAEEKSEKPAKEEPASKEEKLAEEPKKEEVGGGSCGAAPEEEKKESAEEETNPYSAKPGLATDKLVAYIEKMLDKPKSIQSRPGFTEAVVDACDRVLKANPAAKEAETLIAAEAKFESLHKKACAGDEASDKALAAFTDEMKADTRARIAMQVAFFQEERKVLNGAELPAEKIPELLKELKDYYAAEKLTKKHLRMASSTVALINKLESGDEREKQFEQFGDLFAKSSDKELARYGKKLAQKPEVEESNLVGKELELDGTTAAGIAFKWTDYRGKVVLVDFWATWCGPCRKEMPHVKELFEKLQAQGFAVVGVSLDKDQDALAEYLAENQIPWDNLAGEETQDLAQKYGVRGIPTMMAVGKDGKVLGVSHSVNTLIPLIEKALTAK